MWTSDWIPATITSSWPIRSRRDENQRYRLKAADEAYGALLKRLEPITAPAPLETLRAELYVQAKRGDIIFYNLMALFAPYVRSEKQLDELKQYIFHGGEATGENGDWIFPFPKLTEESFESVFEDVPFELGNALVEECILRKRVPNTLEELKRFGDLCREVPEGDPELLVFTALGPREDEE